MGIELRDNRGLICGFALEAGGAASPIAIGAVDLLRPPPQPLWLHFNLNDTRAHHWLQECAWLSPESREFLPAHDRNARIEIHGNELSVALTDEFADDPDRFGVLRLRLDATCLITGRRHPLMAVRLLHEDVAGGMPFDSACALFIRLLDHVAARRAQKVAAYADLIDDAEDRVLAGEFLQMKLGQPRREMARLRRQLLGGRHALIDLSARLPTWWDEPAAKDLQRTAQALNAAGQDLELVEERARLLNEEIDSRMAERTNRNLYFVSIAAAVFLPITLISGIFGMNVGGLPWLDDGNGFAWVMGCMLAALIIALAMLRWRNML